MAPSLRTSGASQPAGAPHTWLLQEAHTGEPLTVPANSPDRLGASSLASPASQREKACGCGYEAGGKKGGGSPSGGLEAEAARGRRRRSIRAVRGRGGAAHPGRGKGGQGLEAGGGLEVLRHHRCPDRLPGQAPRHHLHVHPELAEHHRLHPKP